MLASPVETSRPKQDDNHEEISARAHIDAETRKELRSLSGQNRAALVVSALEKGVQHAARLYRNPSDLRKSDNRISMPLAESVIRSLLALFNDKLQPAQLPASDLGARPSTPSGQSGQSGRNISQTSRTPHAKSAPRISRSDLSCEHHYVAAFALVKAPTNYAKVFLRAIPQPKAQKLILVMSDIDSNGRSVSDKVQAILRDALGSNPVADNFA